MESHAIERADLGAALVVDARAGDEVAFARMVDRYHEDLLRVAFVICGDADIAADAAQVAWQTAWRKLGSLKEPDRLRSWLVAIAANEARQLVRRQRRRSVVEISVPVDTSRTLDPGERTAALDLSNALVKLKPEDRALLAMRYVAGMDSTEIAAVLGGSASGTRARLARLLDRLRGDLDRA